MCVSLSAVAVDSDQARVFASMLQDMAVVGRRTYEAVLEGDIRGTFTASLPADTPRSRVEFMQVHRYGCCGDSM
jgi:hypothetical protein